MEYVYHRREPKRALLFLQELLGNANFGKITSASGSRSMQMALKYNF